MSLELFSCTECDKTFDTLGKYNQHLKTHRKPYICEICGRGFGLRADLHRHIKARHRVGNPRYDCGFLDCTIEISRKDNVAKHMKRYHPEKHTGTTSRGRVRIGAKQNSNDDSLIPPALESKSDVVFNWWQSASTGNIFGMKCILDAGFDVNSQAQDRNTALHCAARTGQTAIVMFLLEHHARLDTENEKQETPLFEAAVGGNAECILLLLRAGGPVRMFEPSSWRSGALGFVDHIVRIEDIELVQAMLALETPQLNKDRASKALAFAIAAAKIGQVPMLQSILNSDPGAAESRGRQLSPIYWAVSRGHVSAVRALLAPSGHFKDQSTEPSHQMHRLVQVAAKRGFVAILEMLLEYDPNATIDRGRLIHSAFINGHSDMVRYFSVVQRIDIDPHIIPLHLSASRGHLDMVEFLLDYGVQHDLLDSHKNTALHLAARGGHSKVVESLLSHGAQHDVLNSHAETPLLVAFWNKKLDIIRVLSRYDDTVLEPQETYFQASTLTEVAQRLLDKQILFINSRGHADSWNLDFRSLLYLAAESDDLELARLVLNHQDWDPQDVNMEHSKYSWDFPTALGVAKNKGHIEMAQLLIEHGALDYTQKQQEQPTPIRVEPVHSIREKSSEMQEDMDSTSDSDLEEQPYSYIDEYMNFYGDEPCFTTPNEPEETAQNSRTWMSTVLAE